MAGTANGQAPSPQADKGPGHRKWTCRDFDGWLFAHRGYHREPDAPENSLAAFALAAEHGFGAELDVHLLADGGLAVLHDSKLKRMTGAKGVVEQLSLPDLRRFRLGSSSQTIPTLRQVLDIFNGKTPLIIELKPYDHNEAALTEAVCRELDTYPGVFCIESFHPEVLLWLRKNRPDILRGQLAMNYMNMKKRNGLSLSNALAGTYLLHTFLTKPDFIAYRFSERGNIGNQFQRRILRRAGATWTLRTPEDLKQAQAEGLWPIFENFDPTTSSGNA